MTLLVVPMFHITGMVSMMHTNIYTGSTLVMMPRWDRELAGRLISRWQGHAWTNIPTMVIDLMASPNFDQYDLSSLVHIGGGGAAMPQAVAQRLLEQFGLRYVEGYGLTETAAPSHSNPPDDPKQQCLGIPFMSCDARVVDPETLQEMPVGRAGRNHHARPDGVRRATGSGPTPRRRPSSSSRASASSAPATWAGWTRTAISSSPTASSG